jgi:hypothetical protein
MMHIVLLISQKDYEPFIIANFKNVEIQKTEARRVKDCSTNNLFITSVSMRTLMREAAWAFCANKICLRFLQH